jgi:hypothetical protein
MTDWDKAENKNTYIHRDPAVNDDKAWDIAVNNEKGNEQGNSYQSLSKHCIFTRKTRQ